MGKAENRVWVALRDGVEALGGTCEKLVTPGAVGPPDGLVCWPAQRIGTNGDAIFFPASAEFAETKSKDGKLEPWQERDHARRRRMGFEVFVLWTEEQVEAYLRTRGKKAH